MAWFTASAKLTAILVSRRGTTLFCVSILWESISAPLAYIIAGFIFAGALLGFVLARLQYLSIDDKFRVGASPGEWYWLRHGFRKVGITLHLATILPAGILVIFQVCFPKIHVYKIHPLLTSRAIVCSNNTPQSPHISSDQRIRSHVAPPLV